MTKVLSVEVVKSLRKHKGNKGAVSRELGISRTSVNKRMKTDPIVRSEWQKFLVTLEKEGGTNKKIAKTIVAALDAETTKVVGQGEDREEVTEPDHYARLKATDQCLKIKRLISPDEDKKNSEQHLHLHLESVKTKQLCDELAKQYKFLSGRDIDTEPLPD